MATKIILKKQGGKKMGTRLKFFDVKGKKSFTSDKFTIVRSSGRARAVTTAPSGAKAYVFVKKGFQK